MSSFKKYPVITINVHNDEIITYENIDDDSMRVMEKVESLKPNDETPLEKFYDFDWEDSGDGIRLDYSIKMGCFTFLSPDFNPKNPELTLEENYSTVKSMFDDMLSNYNIQEINDCLWTPYLEIKEVYEEGYNWEDWGDMKYHELKDDGLI